MKKRGIRFVVGGFRLVLLSMLSIEMLWIDSFSFVGGRSIVVGFVDCRSAFFVFHVVGQYLSVLWAVDQYFFCVFVALVFFFFLCHLFFFRFLNEKQRVFSFRSPSGLSSRTS